MGPASVDHIAVEHTHQHCNPVYERERVGNVGILYVKSVRPYLADVYFGNVLKVEMTAQLRSITAVKTETCGLS